MTRATRMGLLLTAILCAIAGLYFSGIWTIHT